jgi:hypothetical protein
MFFPKPCSNKNRKLPLGWGFSYDYLSKISLHVHNTGHHEKDIAHTFSWLPISISKSTLSIPLQKENPPSLIPMSSDYTDFSLPRWCQFIIIAHSLQILASRSTKLLPSFTRRTPILMESLIIS